MPAENQESNPAATGNISPDSAMSWTIEYVKESRFVRVTITGVYNINDHMRMLKDVAACNFWKSDMNLLIDDRELNFQSTSLEELREAGSRRAELDALIGNGKTAVLTASLTDFARAR
jgi:hypothetical protein